MGRRSSTRIAFVLSALLVASPAAGSGRRRVENGNDSGPGSFRAAIDAANSSPAIREITFAPDLSVRLASDVTYTGRQSLLIQGSGSEILGSPAAPPAPTWDGGLFVSTGGSDLTIRDLAFRESFNNGVGVFVPSGETGTVAVVLVGVTIDRSRFHGLFFDGQHSKGFDTDDVVHPSCVDPHPFDSAASLSLRVVRAAITNNGSLAGGYDTGVEFERDGETYLSGCPADFDGIRVDDGGPGGIWAALVDAKLTDNLADGVEYDERGDGDVNALFERVDALRNGDTGTVDRDDGLDIDEEDAGDLVAWLSNSVIVDNFDEGIDFDEADAGSATVTLVGVESSRNGDQGLQLGEEDAGHLTIFIADSTIGDSRSQDGIELTEEDPGDIIATVFDTRVGGNDDSGLKAEQDLPGRGLLTIIGSDLTGNNDNPSLDLDQVAVERIRTLIDP